MTLGGSVGLRACQVGILRAEDGPYGLWTAEVAAVGFRDLLVAAVLAANPHNSQPWKFRVGEQSIDVLLDRSRSLGPVDPFLRQMQIGIGCAIENLCVAARARGLSAAVALTPDAQSFDLAARVSLAPAGVIDVRHHEVVRRRHTNRGPYDRARAIDDSVRRALEAEVVPGEASLELFDAGSARGIAFAEATVAATEALIADADFMRATDAWFRWTPREAAKHADGPSLHCAGLSPLIELAAVLGKRQGPATFHASWLETTRDVHLATAPMFGRILVAAGQRARFIEAGRLWQRLQLEATKHGLGMQPLDQAIEASERARQLIDPSLTAPELAGPRLAMMFRLGHPLRPALPSARRPLDDVLLPPAST